MTKFLKLFCMACCLFSINFGQAAFAQTTAEIARGNCKSTIDMCQKTLNYCNEKKGKWGEASVTNALKDCIAACKQTDDLLNRGSAYLEQKSCKTTIDAATNCAKACDKFPGDTQMAACANECRKTIGNCTKISSGEAIPK